MQVTIELNDKVYYRGGNKPWTVIKLPDPTVSWLNHYRLVNAAGDRHTNADESDLSLIIEVETKGRFRVVLHQINEEN